MAMVHPIFSVLITRPELVMDHVAGYAALVQEEASTVGVQVARRLGVQLARRHRVGTDYLEQGIEWCGRPKRRPAGQQLVQDAAKAVDVAGRPNGAAAAGGLLRRHVARGAEDGAAARQAGAALDALGEAEVSDERNILGERGA